jgi:hypothetical protein
MSTLWGSWAGVRSDKIRYDNLKPAVSRVIGGRTWAETVADQSADEVAISSVSASGATSSTLD